MAGRSKRDDIPWWEEKDPAKKLQSVVTKIRQSQATRTNNNHRLINIYQYGFKVSEYIEGSDPALTEYMLSFPALKQAVDTVWSKQIKAKIIPMALASGGGYMERRKAKDLSKALQAEFDANNWDKIKELVIKDSLVTAYGAGVVKVYSDGTKVVMEPVPPETVHIDDLEGSNGNPRNYYQTIEMDKYVALGRYGVSDPDLFGSTDYRATAIYRGTSTTKPDSQSTVSDLVELTEAWHLPSGPDADDGLHVIGCAGATLFREKWGHDSSPFAFMIPRRRCRGFWGISFAYDMASAQCEFERVGAKLQRAVQKMGGSHVIAPRSANLNPEEIDNDVGTFIEHDGPPGSVSTFNPEPFNQSVFQWWQQIPSMMFRYRGISETSSASQVPAGLQQASGKALQVFESFEDERLLPEHRELERLVVRISELIVRAWKELVEGGSYKPESRERDTLKQYDIRKLLDGKKDPVISIFPVSELAKSPSAKFEQVTELLKIGAISVDQFRRLYDMPDIESETEMDTADVDIIDSVLEKIVVDGEYTPPEPFDNLQMCMKRGRQFLNICRRRGEPSEKLILIHQYILDAKSLLDSAQSAAAPPPGEPSGTAAGEPPAGPAPGGPI